MSGAFSKFSTAMGRATHKVMAKMGKAEDTHDPEYQFALDRAKNDGKKIKLIARHSEKLVELLHTTTVVMGEISDEFKGVYTDPSGPGAAPLAQYGTTVKEAEAARAALEQELRTNLIEPLDTYYVQYKEIKRRAKILATRKTDMDRYHEKVLKLTEKTTGAKDGLPQADAKYRAARDSYDMLRAEMMGDMPKLNADLAPFMAPAIAVFCREVGRFGAAFGDIARPLAPSVSRIDTSVLHGWPSVITPPERTVAGAPSAAAAAPASSSSATTTAAATPCDSSSCSVQSKSPVASPPHRALPAPMPAAAAPPSMGRVKALYNFNAEDATELSMKKGDVVTLIGKQGEWWEGELNGRRGLFPANYVAPLQREVEPYGRLRLLRKSGLDGKSMTLKKRYYTIGSKKGCEVQMMLPCVDPIHALLRVDLRSSKVLLEPKSPKGVVLGDGTVVEDEVVTLAPGSVFQVGTRKFRFDALPTAKKEKRHYRRQSRKAKSSEEDSTTTTNETPPPPDSQPPAHAATADADSAESSSGSGGSSSSSSAVVASEEQGERSSESPRSVRTSDASPDDDDKTPADEDEAEAAGEDDIEVEEGCLLRFRRINTGEVVDTPSIVAFAKRYHLQRGGIAGLVAGRVKEFKHWEFIKKVRTDKAAQTSSSSSSSSSSSPDPQSEDSVPEPPRKRAKRAPSQSKPRRKSKEADDEENDEERQEPARGRRRTSRPSAGVRRKS
eukprot:m51a1_g11833 putative sh3 domain-containing protein (725) ;mRNA; r:442232-445161